MTDSRKLRRQAAWLCFEPHLNEEQCLGAIQMLEHGYQVEGVTNQISYIGAVCARYGISEKVRKSLYLNFHQLLSDMPESAIDPLTRLQGDRQRPVPKSPLDSVTDQKPCTNGKPNAKPPAQVVIFSQLAYQVQDDCKHCDLFATLRHLTEDGRNRNQVFAGIIEHWSKNPDNFSWALKLEEAELKQFVHLLYTGVCEALGPVEADRCFHRALAVCERRAEAKEFPPARFL